MRTSIAHLSTSTGVYYLARHVGLFSTSFINYTVINDIFQNKESVGSIQVGSCALPPNGTGIVRIFSFLLFLLQT